ncbi:MAG: HYR domain-containing protein [Verrucomicrobiaceae bacterium]|nr:HYR domain-containing protein [Verrucomicrobiaceae bacterium]
MKSSPLLFLYTPCAWFLLTAALQARIQFNWHRDDNVPPLWNNLSNWSPEWDPSMQYGQPYPSNYEVDNLSQHLFDVYLTNDVSGDGVIIPANASIDVMGLNMDPTVNLVIQGWLTVHGGYAVPRAGGSASINRDLVISGENPSIFAPGLLGLGSGPSGWGIGLDYWGVEALEIGEEGDLTLELPGSKIINYDNLFSFITPAYAFTLTERIVSNRGVFEIRDRGWRPKAPPHIIDTVRLINQGELIVNATIHNAAVGGIADLFNDTGLIDHEEGLVIVSARPGLSASVYLTSLVHIQGDEAIELDGEGALVFGGEDGLDKLRYLGGVLRLINGASLDVLRDGSPVEAPMEIERDMGAMGLDAELALEGDSSYFRSGDLRVIDGTVIMVGGVSNLLHGVDSPSLPMSFEDGLGAEILTLPAFPPAHGLKSRNLAVSEATVSAGTRMGQTYTLKFKASGGQLPRGGKVIVSSPTLPLQAPLEFPFAAPGNAAYIDVEVEFEATNTTTYITFTADPVEPGTTVEIGPVIDALWVTKSQFAPLLDVVGELSIHADDVAEKWGEVMVGTGHVRAESIVMDGKMSLEGGIISGYTTADSLLPVPITVLPGAVNFDGELGGFGDIYSNNLFVGGVLKPEHLIVHGNVTLQAAGALQVDITDGSALQVVPLASGGGNLALNGRLAVRYTLSAPPLPADQITVATASSISGTFGNLVNGRVRATSQALGGGIQQFVTGSFAVTITSTAITLSGFQAGPSLEVPADITVEALSAAGSAVTFAVTAQNAGWQPLVPIVSHSSGSVFPVGPTTVEATAQDAVGQAVTGRFVVTVRDTTPPVVTAPADRSVAAASSAGAVVNYDEGTAADTVGVTAITYDPPSGSLLPVGATVVTVTARDAAGNQGTSIFTVTITPPATNPLQLAANVIAAAGLNGPAAALDATPHDDGVANLLKYAFNMNLSGPDSRTMASGGSGGLPGITTQPNGPSSIFRYEFLRRRNSGLIYTPQKSPDITLPNSWVPLTDTPTIIPIDDTWERVIYEEPYNAATTPKCFGRVQVTLPP